MHPTPQKKQKKQKKQWNMTFFFGIAPKQNLIGTFCGDNFKFGTRLG